MCNYQGHTAVRFFLIFAKVLRLLLTVDSHPLFSRAMLVHRTAVMLKKTQLSPIDIKGEGKCPEWFLNWGKCPVGRDCPRHI